MALRTLLARGARLAAPLAVRARSVPFVGQTPALSSGASAVISRTALLSFAAASAAGCGVSFAAAPPESTPLTKEEIAACIAAIEEILDEDDDMGPTLVRLAWHASGTYDKESGTGGSDGATMRFSPEANHGANAGLGVARDTLEKVKKLFPNITYADLWTLAGVVAIEHMGGPKVNWQPGRRDALDESECTPDGRLPDADKGGVGKTVRHIRDIFYRQGFNDREIVALIGAHALGRCYADRSGYEGPWTRSATTFSNTFYTELLNNKWTLKNWDGPDQFEDQTGDLMMLPTDMALLWDKEFRKFTEEFAKDEDLFFKEFAKAFQKLEENGVKSFSDNNTAVPWYKFW